LSQSAILGFIALDQDLQILIWTLKSEMLYNRLGVGVVIFPWWRALQTRIQTTHGIVSDEINVVNLLQTELVAPLLRQLKLNHCNAQGTTILGSIA